MAKQINPGQMLIFAATLLSLLAILFAGMFSRLDSIILGLGVAMVGYSLEQTVPMTLLLASLATFLSAYLPFGNTSSYLIQGFNEGFQNSTDEEAPPEQDEQAEEDPDSEDEAEAPPAKEVEGFAAEKKGKKRRPPPDNGSRKEMFELGKAYKMPKETDDPEYHLDAGTTFINAYKSLNPDQVSAMTKDTQDLINTQKQLMSTLNTLKPLITDGKQMMDTFQNYFGTAAGGGIGDLSKMADKFAPQ